MKKKRPKKRQTSDEEMSRAADARLKRIITNSAIEMVKRDPEVQRQMVAQTFGYHIPDRVEKRQRELIEYIDRRTIERLEQDDEFTRRVVEARIRQVTGEMGLQIEDKEPRNKQLGIDDMIERAKKYKELAEILGVKEPGFGSSFKDPQVLAGIVSLISQYFNRKQPPVEDEVWILVQVDGTNKLIRKEDYERITGKVPVAYIGGEEPSRLDDESKSDGQTAELKTPDTTDADDEKAGTATTGD
ncbi:hypothetical protein ACFLV5_02040 [Chloroflexota bacterium]